MMAQSRPNVAMWLERHAITESCSKILSAVLTLMILFDPVNGL